MKKYLIEAGIIVALLAGIFSFNYYSNFISTGHLITQTQQGTNDTFPAWAESWAGAPWSFFNSSTTYANITSGDMLIYSASDPVYIAENGTAVIDILAKGDYIWKNGWFWNGTAWVSFTFDVDGSNGGSGAYYSSGWVTSAARTSFAADLVNGTYWYVAYTCQWVNSQWKCGCRDVNNCGRWQIQSIKAI